MEETELRLPNEGFVREKQLLQVIPVSNVTLRRMIRDGRFPAPVELSEGIKAWRVQDVRAWIEAKSGNKL